MGVKVRLSAAAETGGAAAALEQALEASRAAGVPLMVDVGGPGDFMPEALDRLGPGDILTHCFTGGGATIVDEAGRVRREARDARARGVRFDIGHGCGSFAWRSARAAVADGFPPDSISSDLHRYSVDVAGVDCLTMMAKFLALGMSLADVVGRVTVGPGASIGSRRRRWPSGRRRTSPCSGSRMPRSGCAMPRGRSRSGGSGSCRC